MAVTACATGPKNLRKGDSKTPSALRFDYEGKAARVLSKLGAIPLTAENNGPENRCKPIPEPRKKARVKVGRFRLASVASYLEAQYVYDGPQLRSQPGTDR